MWIQDSNYDPANVQDVAASYVIDVKIYEIYLNLCVVFLVL